jgi:hypothetical protein
MALFIADTMQDAALDYGAACTTMTVCSAQPANFAGISAVAGGSYTLTPNDGGGDWTIANGDVSGRKLSVATQTGNNATASITVTHIAYDQGSELRMVSTTTSKAITNTEPFDVTGYNVVEYRDPVAA